MRGVFQTEARAFYFPPKSIGFVEVFFLTGGFTRFGEATNLFGGGTSFFKGETEEIRTFEECFFRFFRVSEHFFVEARFSISDKGEKFGDRLGRIEIVFERLQELRAVEGGVQSVDIIL